MQFEETTSEISMTGVGSFMDKFREMNDGYEKMTIPPTGGRRDMHGNFIDVIRKGGQLNCNVNLGAATMVAIKMGVESYRQKKTMLWDAEKEKMIVS